MRSVLALLALFAVVVLGGAHGDLVPEAAADVGDRLPRLARLRGEVVREGMPRGYVPLRQIWAEWDQGDPALVEATLAGLGVEAALPAPMRAYAGMLEAYARRRRGDLAGARARIAELGFATRFVVVGPFDNEGKDGLDRAFGPEEDLRAPIDLQRTYPGKERAVAPRLTPEGAFPYGWVDLGAIVRPAESACAYATTFVRDPRAAKAARRASFWIGTAGATKLFVDGQKVLEDARYRGLDADRLAATVTLTEGWHRVTAKVCGDDAPPMLSLRVADAAGAPDPAIEIDPDPVHASRDAAVMPKRRTEVVTGGPLPAFEKRAAGGDARELEAYARWLVLTQADDPSENAARTLASRAATGAPTLDRCLLAGDLAENRNQRAVWIERAEALAKRGASLEDRIKVLLARAAHTRSGAHFRDAIPTFDAVLALDPDNVPANLARVELHSEAGLRETALAKLEGTLARRPRSVALLRAHAAALRDMERTTEADEATERYAAYRFDDTGVLEGRIELALARRDAASASRWTARLLETNPDSARAYATAARAYAHLGDGGKAIATQRKALELAPDDVPALRALADLHALAGQADEQQRLLRRVLDLRPQEKDVREYLAHLEPSRPRADEAYTRPAKEFLALRGAPAGGRAKRTLVDLQVTTVFPNGLASRFHQVVFQPLTDAAATEAREYVFSFQEGAETVQLRGARIHRRNGQVDEAIESGEGAADDPSIAMYTSARAFYVRFPRLDPGDVVELLYRVEDITPRNAFADYFGEVVYMQATEPIAHAEYVLITPRTRTFFFNTPTLPGLTRITEDRSDRRVDRFVAENVAALDPEPGQPPLAETLGHVHVSTYRSWDDMGRWYWGLVRDQLVADEEVRRRAAEITKGLVTDRQKVAAVYGYVVQKTRYVALEFGIHGFKPYRCAQIFARGFGDCKDKATLIVTMLKELGIPATLVVLRTGLRGDFESEPASLAPFDHAIAYVPSLDLYLDGTAEFTGTNELPSMDRGALGLQINEGKPRLVHLPHPPPEATVRSRRVEATLTADGDASLAWRVAVSGGHAPSYRQRYHAKATQKVRVAEDLAQEIPGATVTDVTANDLEDVEAPVAITARGSARSYARRDGDRFTIGTGAREHMVKTYAALGARKREVRIPVLATEENETLVHLPAGARVVSAPSAAKGASTFGDYEVEAETDPQGTVRVKTRVRLRSPRVAAKDYAAFRAFCEEVDRALGQTLTYVVAK